MAGPSDPSWTIRKTLDHKKGQVLTKYIIGNWQATFPCVHNWKPMEPLNKYREQIVNYIGLLVILKATIIHMVLQKYKEMAKDQDSMHSRRYEQCPTRVPPLSILCNLERRLLQYEEWNAVRHIRWMVLIWVRKLDNKIRITFLWKINVQKNSTCLVL